MMSKNSSKMLARMAKRRLKTREEKALLQMEKERQTLCRALWNAPLVDLEKPYQRGWYREFELTEKARRRSDVAALEELLTFANNVQCCRKGKFLRFDPDSGREVPRRHQLRRFPLFELRRLSFPPDLYCYLKHEGSSRLVTKSLLEEPGSRWSGKFEVNCSHYFCSVTKPLIITQRKVDMPATRARIAEIENHFDQIHGWHRWRNLRGRRWRRYDYAISPERQRERQELKELHEKHDESRAFFVGMTRTRMSSRSAGAQ
jgi:hypothetical protein